LVVDRGQDSRHEHETDRPAKLTMRVAPKESRQNGLEQFGGEFDAERLPNANGRPRRDYIRMPEGLAAIFSLMRFIASFFSVDLPFLPTPGTRENIKTGLFADGALHRA